MHVKAKAPIVASVGVAASAAVLSGCGTSTEQLIENPAQAKSQGVKKVDKRKKAISPATKKAVTVGELASKPASYLGRATVVGIVATTAPGKSFLLLDSDEYRKCGLTCLMTEPGNKIPVRWLGATPKAEQSVRVEGVLAKTAQGFIFTAHKVGKA